MRTRISAMPLMFGARVLGSSVLYPPVRLLVSSLLLAALGTGAAACSTYRDHLTRGQHYYDVNEYERALSIWRVLEADMDSLNDNDQARYAYLRGMTDYRLGFRSHARHWLAIAKSIDKRHPGGLTPELHTRANDALTDLNKDVFGVERLAESNSTVVEHDRGAASGVESQSGQEKQKSGLEKPKACGSDADCAADQACIANRCTTP